jgi:hypothetical protein
MAFGRRLFVNLAGGFTILALVTAVHASPPDCREPETGTKAVPTFSPPIGNSVMGPGQLPFYSAPSLNCPMKGIFVVPRDEVVAYAETKDGWSSVMYVNPRSGNQVSGWVRSARLKAKGTLGPSQ